MKICEIRDPVLGFITLDEWEREIINHPVFQRLRRVRQLAWTDMVYPGTTHTILGFNIPWRYANCSSNV